MSIFLVEFCIVYNLNLLISVDESVNSLHKQTCENSGAIVQDDGLLNCYTTCVTIFEFFSYFTRYIRHAFNGNCS